MSRTPDKIISFFTKYNELASMDLIKATIVLWGIVSVAVSVCLDGWIRHGGSCYHFSHGKENWLGSMMGRSLTAFKLSWGKNLDYTSNTLLKKMKFSTVTILLLWITSYAECTCPDGWLKHQTSCYHFSHDKEPWSNAFQICQILGGSLLEIQDSTENDYIMGQLSSHGSSHYEPFLALTDLAEENVWVWMVSQVKLGASGYTNWASGEPNNDGQENCVNMESSGMWNDAECDRSHYYVCEKPDEEGSQIIG